MSQTVAKVRGRLSADGKLELLERPELGEGEVDVVMRLRPRADDRPREGVVEVLRRIQEERRALGIPGRTREEIDAQINALRDECEEHLAELAEVQDRGRQEREKREC